MSEDLPRLWSADGKLLAALEGHTGRVNSAVFSPDELRIVTASADGTARLWSANGKFLAVLEGRTAGVNNAVFSPHGSRILTASNDNTARLWSTACEPIATLEGNTGNVQSAVFSPDGSRILTISDDETVRLWSAKGELVGTLKGHSGVFAPHGSRILTASDDNGKAVMLPETTGALVAAAKPAAPRCLTPEQRKNAYLGNEPPRWCITGAGREAERDPAKWQPKWPYKNEAWKEWLAAKDR